MTRYVHSTALGLGKTSMLLVELKEREYHRQLRPTLPYIPRGACKTNILMSLERKVLTDLALKNWWMRKHKNSRGF